MNIDYHDTFQRMIDESLAGVLSAEKEQSLREHLSTCATCREYLSASNRVIAGLSGFSFEVNPTFNARVLAAIRLQAEEGRGILARDTWTMRHHSAQFKNWAAFAVALSMSFVGSGLVYQMAERLTVPNHFVTAQVQAGVLIFWLLPSLCAALCLLAAPGENRGNA
jgi:anti-sigma-K factor RskA